MWIGCIVAGAFERRTRTSTSAPCCVSVTVPFSPEPLRANIGIGLESAAAAGSTALAVAAAHRRAMAKAQYLKFTEHRFRSPAMRPFVAVLTAWCGWGRAGVPQMFGAFECVIDPA